MLYKTLEVEDLIDLKEADREMVDLMENNGAHLKLVALKKHQELEPHMAHTNVTIFIIDGELEINFPQDANCACQACGCDLPDEDDENGRKYKLKKGQLFLFEKDTLHSIKALKDTSFLLIKI